MADDPNKTAGTPEPAPADPQPSAEPKQPEPSQKGGPDLKAQNQRLNQDNAALKEQIAQLTAQAEELNKSLQDALTADDVNAAVKAAQEKAQADFNAAQAGWDADRKKLTVENLLVGAGCIDPKAVMAHLTIDDIEIAKDGHVSGLDTENLKENYPYLFQQGNVGTVASAATPGGNAKKITREDIAAIKDGSERRAAIMANLDLYD